ncbi:DUF4956 domain-containing protein [Streptomyces paromomycinus]|uniref:DUF4956 domain-containing protein n=1 Tax=Streptomyces paromomycinus TaxID=92743 RepID=A0A401W5P0_STREY|nr:DUF4956 domain-containing protein [Streptomyces paromomycinus]GCD44664.1 DUF4956 domain-containing protein [Streptomyces paromomycinus]
METLGRLTAHLVLDLTAVSVLTFAIYYPRHRRRDLVPAYLALNVALFAVVSALAQVGEGGAALGFGLFGVLSIIRLRSDSIQHEEVAYYFTTLVLGLLCGLPHLGFAVAATLAALLLLVMYGADHPRLMARTCRTVVTLDAVHTDQRALCADLARRLGGEPCAWTVKEIDFVRDLMVVDVRFRLPEPFGRPARTTSQRTDRNRPRTITRSPAHPKPRPLSEETV